MGSIIYPPMYTHLSDFHNSFWKDVVGTKRRTWQHHPGNVFYRDVIQKNMPRILDNADKTPAKAIAKEILHVITKERGAVFLRSDEERGGWFVMNEVSSLNKVWLAIKNCEIKANKRSIVKVTTTTTTTTTGGGGGSSKRKKVVDADSSKESTGPRQEYPALQYVAGRPPAKVAYSLVYEVKEGPAVALDQYTKDMINLMCRQTNPNAAATALDVPLTEHFKTIDDEPDKQRILRLQLRQRFIAAMTIGISPVNFSRLLMKTWGGSISERMESIDADAPHSEANCNTIEPMAKVENVSPVEVYTDAPVEFEDNSKLVPKTDAPVKFEDHLKLVPKTDAPVNFDDNSKLVPKADAPVQVQDAAPVKVSDDAKMQVDNEGPEWFKNDVQIKVDDIAGTIAVGKAIAIENELV